MAVIKAEKVEFEVLKQEVNGAAAKFMLKLASEDQADEDIELATNTAGFAAQLKQEYEKELQRLTQQK